MALPFRWAAVTVPPGVVITAGKYQWGPILPGMEKLVLAFPKDWTFPFDLNIFGAMGINWVIPMETPTDLRRVDLKPGFIKDGNPRPSRLEKIPKLCSRLFEKQGRGLYHPQAELIYDGNKDALNHFPTLQLTDPDLKKSQQYKTSTEMDGSNVLLLKKVTLRYDYEDDQIIDYQGPNPLTGEEHTLFEGRGGFYANIHYAVIPYVRGYKGFDRQLLLHLAEGRLTEINQEEHRPEIRTHGFLPGPFTSGKKKFYEMCEWGDSGLMPEQTLNYQGMALWDWDFSVSNADSILLIVWEGDEEDWLIRDQLISPFYVTDDLIGIFEIKEKETMESLTLVNDAGDFEITIQTGNIL